MTRIFLALAFGTLITGVWVLNQPRPVMSDNYIKAVILLSSSLVFYALSFFIVKRKGKNKSGEDNKPSHTINETPHDDKPHGGPWHPFDDGYSSDPSNPSRGRGR